MSLHRAAREQQLQHLPLQEVPQHVRGPEADRPVQGRKQNGTRSEGRPLPPHVRQVLIWDPNHYRLSGNKEGNDVTAHSHLDEGKDCQNIRWFLKIP